MKTFSARTNTDAETASIDLEAETPEQALAKAREIAEGDDGSTLPFEGYSELHPVNEIIIEDEHGAEVAGWQDQELRLCLHAGMLLAASAGADVTERVRTRNNAIEA